jgi:short-subunit dehydrogenase
MSSQQHSEHAKGTVVVTGASSGIGYELSRVFAENGYPLLLVARNREKLQALAQELQAAHHVAVSTCVADLAVSDGARQVVDAAHQLGRPVEILVNNAGFGVYGPFIEADVDATLQMLQVNVVSLTHLTRLLLPEMVQRNSGRILNVASVAAFVPGPFMAVYYASKAYVLHFSEALDEELSGSNVRVTALCPGPTATGFESRAGLGKSKLFSSQKVMDARTVAEDGYRGLMRGRRLVVPGWRNKLVTESTRLSPRWLLAKIARRLQEPRS